MLLQAISRLVEEFRDLADIMSLGSYLRRGSRTKIIVSLSELEATHPSSASNAVTAWPYLHTT